MIKLLEKAFSETELDKLSDEALKEYSEGKTKPNELILEYDNPVIRALIQLIPFGIGSALDVILSHNLERITNERTKAFFDELDNGEVSLDKRCLESEDFLHKYFKTTQYALNTRRREKIRLFAKLFKSSIENIDFCDIDEYEEYLQILDELNYRELQALVIFDDCSDFSVTQNRDSIEWVGETWQNFVCRLENELGIPTPEASSFMVKVVRTGCFEMITGGYGGDIGGVGKLTPIYMKLKEFIKLSSSEV
ncbi:MAG: hypothetical protein HQ568_04820 [Calditrichaeota bacterium]|nr:hypothetical protein [Calditrichota bacterium]